MQTRTAKRYNKTNDKVISKETSLQPTTSGNIKDTILPNTLSNIKEIETSNSMLKSILKQSKRSMQQGLDEPMVSNKKIKHLNNNLMVIKNNE